MSKVVRVTTEDQIVRSANAARKCADTYFSVRQRVQEGLALPAEISATDFAGDEFLKPVLDDDALIVSLDSLPETQQQESGGKAHSSTGADASSADSLEKENQQLRSELESLTRQFENYRLAVSETLDQRWGVDGQLSEASKEATDAKQTPKREGEDQEKASVAGGTDYYFESYSHSGTLSTLRPKSMYDPQNMLLTSRLMRRYPRDDAQGRDTDGCLPRLHLRQQASVRRKDSPRYWLRHGYVTLWLGHVLSSTRTLSNMACKRYFEHVLCQGRSKACYRGRQIRDNQQGSREHFP